MKYSCFSAVANVSGCVRPGDLGERSQPCLMSEYVISERFSLIDVIRGVSSLLWGPRLRRLSGAPVFIMNSVSDLFFDLIVLERQDWPCISRCRTIV